MFDELNKIYSNKKFFFNTWEVMVVELRFTNTTKCPTKLLIKKWDVVLSGPLVCLYSQLQCKREILVCLPGR